MRRRRRRPRRRRTCGWPGSRWPPGSPRWPGCTSPSAATAWLAAVAAALALVAGLRPAPRAPSRLRRERPAGSADTAGSPSPSCSAWSAGRRRPGPGSRSATPPRSARWSTERALVTADLVVRDDPRRVRGSPGRPAPLLVRVDLVRLTGPDGRQVTGPVRGLVLATDPGWQRAAAGAAGHRRGRLAEPRGGDLTAAVLSATGPPTRHGPPSWVQRAAGTLRAGLQRACEPLPDDAGRAAARTGGGGHQPAATRGRGGLPGHRDDAPQRGVRFQRGDHRGCGAVAGPLGARRPAYRRRALRPGPGRVRHPGAAVAERGAGRRDGRDRARRAGRRAPPGRAARAGRRGRRAGAAGPGAGRGSRASRCRSAPPAGCCCSRPGGGTRCAVGAYRRGWPRHWRCRPPRSSRAAR